jgi:hypothetical protein
MSHAALVNDGLFLIVVLMTLLLVMFLYAVIEAPLEDAVPAEAPVLNTPVLAPPAPAPALPVRRPQAPVFPAGAAGQSGDAGYAARHTTAAVPLISPPEVSSGPPWGPVSGPVLAIAGLAIAVIGGWMFRSTGHAATVCSHGLSCLLPSSSSVGPSPRFDPQNADPVMGPVFA